MKQPKYKIGDVFYVIHGTNDPKYGHNTVVPVVYIITSITMERKEISYKVECFGNTKSCGLENFSLEKTEKELGSCFPNLDILLQELNTYYREQFQPLIKEKNKKLLEWALEK